MKDKNKKEELGNKNNSKKYIVIAIFFVAVLSTNFTTYKLLVNRKLETIKSPSFHFLNPARMFISQKDLIINIQPLRDELNTKYEKDPNVSVYFEYLPTGANISVNKDAEFYPASLLKTPVAIAVAKKIDKGEWKWDNKLVLMANDKDDKFGTLYKEPTGSVFTIEELVKRSLVDSDNTAHFILLRNLELSEINDVYKHMGLDGFLDTDGSLSAKRYSVILRSLYNSSYLKEESSQKIISFLTEEKFRDYLGSGFPLDVSFAHKIGTDTEKKIYLDAGIVYLENRPYILVVMTRGKSEQESKGIMQDISTKAYNYILNYKE